MLNRLRRVQDFEDEREALLAQSIPLAQQATGSKHSNHTDLTPPNQHPTHPAIGSGILLANNQPRQVSSIGSRDYRDEALDISTYSQIKSRNQAKINVEAANQSHSSKTPFYNNADNYELQRIAAGQSNSRAIDITGSVYNFQESSSHRNNAPHVDFIYYTIQPGDTLQNLSVKYSCPVASIKRLNNLWSDQEFYGLARIKLPVGKLRLIAEVLGQEQTDIPQSTYQAKTIVDTTENSFHRPPATESYGDHDKSLSVGLSRENHHYQQQPTCLDGDSIFRDLDLNIEKARTAARCYDKNASSIMHSLSQGGNIVADDCDQEDPSRMARREAEILLNDMSDYGLTYSGLILFIFIVCLICPLAYIIYLEETHHDSNKVT